MRLLNLCVLALLVLAAAYVYEIKFESTLRAERVAKLRGEVRRERDAIAALRAEWATLDNPARIQGLARRHLQLKPAEAAQYRHARPPAGAAAADRAAAAGRSDRRHDRELATRPLTGSVPAPMRAAMTAIDDSRCRRMPPSAWPRRRPSRGGAALMRHAALRPQRRPHRQGARPRRPRDPRLRRGLCGHRRAARHVRGGAGQPFARRGASRRRGRDRAARHPRPQRRVLATDVRAPSLFGEPRKIIDVDEAVELLTAVLPDLDADGSARPARLAARLRLAQARDHAEAAAGDLPARPSRHRLPHREQARLSERRRGRRT